LYGITEAWAGGSGERIGEIGEYLNTATAAMDTAESGSIYRFGLFFLCSNSRPNSNDNSSSAVMSGRGSFGSFDGAGP